MNCWRRYYAAGVPADTRFVVGISAVSGILALAGLLAAVDM
jgi:hypothetical protein